MTDSIRGKSGALYWTHEAYSDGPSSIGGQNSGSDWVFPLSQDFVGLSPASAGFQPQSSGASYLETFGDVMPTGSALVGFAANGHSGGGGGGAGGSPPPTYISPTENGLTFIINWDSSVGNAPTGFVDGFKTAVGYFLNNLGSPIPTTVTLDVGWGEAGGQRLPVGALGESLTNINLVSYSDLQAKMSGYLPQTDPIATSPHSYWVASAEEKALGLIPNNNSLDGSLGFSSRVTWDFTTAPPAKGQYDFISVAEHEISETMGRIALLGSSISDNGVIYTGGYSPLDLFRYSAPGARSLVGGQTAYFSPDGGVSSGATNPVGNGITYFNSTAGGDWGDWQSSGSNSAGNDAYNAFASTGVQYTASAVDNTVMNVLGFVPIAPIA